MPKVVRPLQGVFDTDTGLLIGVIPEGVDDVTYLPGTSSPGVATGAGDMLASTYDPNGDGKIDIAQTTGFGTAAALDVGTSAGNVVQVLTGGKLPALDASNLTNLPGGSARVVSFGFSDPITADGTYYFTAYSPLAFTVSEVAWPAGATATGTFSVYVGSTEIVTNHSITSTAGDITGLSQAVTKGQSITVVVAGTTSLAGFYPSVIGG